MGEALTFDFGFLHYLWVKAMKEQKQQKDSTDNMDSKMIDVFGDLGIK